LTSIARGITDGFYNVYKPIKYFAAELSSFAPDTILSDAAKYF